MKRLLLTSITATALAGCATTPLPSDAAKPVPAERVLALQTRPVEPSGILTITRDVGYIAAACYLAISIDGTVAARFGPGETASFYAPPGEVVLRVGRDPGARGTCSWGPEDWTQRETTLKQGEKKYFRISIDANGKKDIQRADQ